MLDVQPIINAAIGACKAETLELGKYHVIHTPDGVTEINLTGDEWLDRPKRKQGKVTVGDVDSFATYWEKHSDAGSQIYADRERRQVTAVLDAHEAAPEGARFGQHRLVLALNHSEAWKAWIGQNEQEMGQEPFVEFIEDNRADIASPPAAEMLEIASSISATTKATFESGMNLHNGQRQLTYVEQINGTAGAQKKLTIPTEFELHLPVFDGAKNSDVLVARFRYRIYSGKLVLLYKLDRPAEVIKAAFEGIVAEVGEACNTTVLRGSPA